MNLCPCGKDVTNMMYQYHKYMCPKMEKQKGVDGKVAGASRKSRPSITDSENRKVSDAPRRSTPARPISRSKEVKSDKPSPRSAVTKLSPKSRLEQITPDFQPEQPCKSDVPTSSKEPHQKQIQAKGEINKPTLSGHKAEHPGIAPHECRNSKSLAEDTGLRRRMSQVRPKSSKSPSSLQSDLRQNTTVEEESSDDSYAPIRTSTLSWTNKKQTLVPKPRTSSGRSKQATQTEKGTKVEKTTSTNSKERKIIDTKELDEIVDRMHTEGVIKRSKCPKNDVKVFFDKEVKLTQSEITTVKKRVKILSDKIMRKLEDETNLSGWEIRNAGSSSDGTKVSHLNEMDCIMFPGVSNKMKAVFDETCVPGFCKVMVEGCVDGTDVGLFSDGVFLNSRKFRHYVFKKLESIVEGDRFLKDARTYPETLSFAIKYTAIPTETDKMLSVDVDFVPSIHIRAWPQPQHARDITKVLEDKTKAQGIRSHGFNATPKHCASGSTETNDLLWQVSFSYAEKQITKYGDKCWKPVMRTLKRIRDIAKGGVDSTSRNIQLSQIQGAAEYARRNCPSLNRLSLRLTTYHVRTLMWTLRYELTLEGHVWTEDTQANRLRSTLQQFQKMMTGEAIFPHFFIPAVRNIMDGISEKERKYLYIVAKSTEIIFSND